MLAPALRPTALVAALLAAVAAFSAAPSVEAAPVPTTATSGSPSAEAPAQAPTPTVASVRSLRRPGSGQVGGGAEGVGGAASVTP